MRVLKTSEDDSDRFVFLDTIAGLGRILYLGTKRGIDRDVINIYVAWYIETKALNSKCFLPWYINTIEIRTYFISR